MRRFVATLALSALALPLPACARGQMARALAPAPAPAAPAPAHADTAALRRQLDSIADAHHGIVGYTVWNIDTGERLERRGDETFPTASLIKVPILVTLYSLVNSGRLSLDEPVTLDRLDKVGGSGILQFIHDDAILTIGDAAWLMGTLSDNTATNLVLDKIDIGRVWAKMDSLGLHHTKVFAKVFKGSLSTMAKDSTEKYGLGVTTPNEMATLFDLLAQGKAVSPAADSAALYLLQHNDDERKLARFVPGVRFAHKTGDVNDAKTDCGIFYLQSRVIACVLTKENKDQSWRLDNEAYLTMAHMGEAIVNAWPRASTTASR